MGNHRFRLSDMMPNAWFYKLKDMSRTRNRNTSQPIKKKLPSSQTTTTTTTTTTTSQKPCFSQPRYSYYFTTEPNRADMFCNSPKIPKASDTHFPDPPRRSSNKRAKRKSIYKPSPTLVSSSVSSAACSCRATINSVWSKPISHQYDDDDDDYFFSSTDQSSPEPEFHECFQPEFESFDERLVSCCGSYGCRVGCSPTDIIIDMNEEYLTRKIEKLDDDIDSISKLELPPILTKKQAKFEEDKEFTKFRRRRSSRLEEIKAQNVKEDGRVKTQRDTPKSNPPVACRKSFSTTSSTGVRLRTNSPRIARTRKIQGNARKSAIASSPKTKSRLSRNKRFSESFAIVKNSIDPEKDFRESMMEMIVANNIRASKDLEELLACYLLLNSNEYHDLIVKAFQQIWFGMT